MPQELERGEGDVLECDMPAACLYVNEPKVKVDLTKYTERHAFRCGGGHDGGGRFLPGEAACNLLGAEPSALRPPAHPQV